MPVCTCELCNYNPSCIYFYHEPDIHIPKYLNQSNMEIFFISKWFRYLLFMMAPFFVLVIATAYPLH